jgi:hypothetical protein
MASPATDVCTLCGQKEKDPCCLDDSGKILDKKCVDGSYCSLSSGPRCVQLTGAFGTPCANVGDNCAVDNLKCQASPTDPNKNLCLCVEDFKPCDKAGGICNPGGTPPTPPPSGLVGNCESSDKICNRNQQHCLTGKTPGACADSGKTFDAGTCDTWCNMKNYAPPS